MRSKLTARMHERIVEATNRGLSVKLVCLAAGVTPSTYTRWMRTGREDVADGRTKTAYARLVLDASQAEAEVAERMFQRIITAAEDPKHWTAAAWLLERRFGFVKPPAVVVNVEATTKDERELDEEFDRMNASVIAADNVVLLNDKRR